MTFDELIEGAYLAKLDQTRLEEIEATFAELKKEIKPVSSLGRPMITMPADEFEKLKNLIEET